MPPGFTSKASGERWALEIVTVAAAEGAVLGRRQC